MSAPLRCVVLSLLLAGALPAGAARADTPSYEAALSRMEEAASAGLAPSSIASPRDVYVIVRMGGAYADITILGHGDAEAAAYAVALERSARGSEMAGKAAWGFDDDWSVGVLSRGKPAPRRRTATSTAPVGRLLEELRLFRLRPHAVLFVAQDAVVSPGGPSHPLSDGNAIVLDGLRPADGVRVTRRVSDTAVALLAAMWGLALVAAAWPLSARRRAREGASPRKRSLWPLAGVLAAQGALLAAAILTPAASQIADVWFGTGRFLAGLMPFAVALTATAVLAGSAVFAALDRPAPGPKTAEEIVRAQRDAWRTRAKVAIFGIIVLSFFLNDTIRQYARLAESFGIAAAVFAVDLAFRRRLAPFERRDPDPRLTPLAQRLAAGTGVLVTAVLIDDTDKGRSGTAVTMREGAVVVPRALADALTAEEAEFVVARAIVHQAMQRDSAETLRLLAPLAAALLLTLALVLRRGAPPWMVGAGALAAAGALALALAVTLSRSKVRRDSLEDGKALELTRNLRAAVSAIDKLQAAATKGQTVIFSGLKGRKKRLAAAARAIGLSVLVALACPHPALAQAPEVSSIDRSVETAIELGLLPPSLRTTQDVYVVARVGAAYAHLAVLGRPGVPPSRLADCLEVAVRGTALAGTVVDTDPDPLYSVAILSYGHRAIGRRSSSTEVPLGALAENLRRAGYVPHFCLRVPAYATSDAPAAWARQASPRFRYYVANAVPPSATVTVRATLPIPALASVAALFLVPLLALLAYVQFALGGRRALRKDHPEPPRWLPIAFTAVGMGVHVVCFQYAARSGAFSAVSDLWLGSLRSSTLMLFSVSGMIFLLAPLVLTHHRLMDPTARILAQVELSPEEKALRTTMDRWKIAVKVLLWVGIIAYFVLGKGKGPHGSFEFLAAGVATVLVEMAFRKRLAPFEGKTADDALARRAQSLAAGTGVTVTEVVVDEGLTGRATITATLLKGRLLVSRRAVDTLTPEELEFTLARAVAGEMKRGASIADLLPLLPMAVMLAPMAFMLRYRGAAHEHFAAMIAAMGVGCFLGIWLLHRRSVAVESARDRRALALTRNYPAALSALMKGLLAGVEALAGRQKSGVSLAKASPARVKALKRSAYELGLSVPEDAVKVRI